MSKDNMMKFIKQLRRPVFTSRELAASSGKSPSTTTQALNYLARQGLVLKVYRGIWIETGNNRISQYSIIPFLFSRQRAYVSFISALHLHGIIEQIPQVVTLASTGHSKIIRTKLGDFSVHQITPKYFKGFDWYREDGTFLIAEPEKALADALYLSAHKKKQFRHFPELNPPKTFRFDKVRSWIADIPSLKTRRSVEKRWEDLCEHAMKRRVERK
jgi:predicted transcriptional regulator of viral defense system